MKNNEHDTCKACGKIMHECSCEHEKCPKCHNCSCSCHRNRRYLKYLAFGLSIAMGPALAGYFISQSLNKPANASDRFITVNVDVEREVKADFVIWRIGFQNTGDDIKVLQEKFVKDRDIIVNFLKSKGFKDEELSIGGPHIVDQFAREWGQADVQKLPDNARYVLDSRVKISTKNVNAVESAVKEEDVLLREGVILTQRTWDTNPRYFLKDQLKLEQDLYGEALQKADVLSKQLADTMKVSIKNLRNTEQSEPVQIMGQGQGQSYESTMERLRGPLKRAHLRMTLRYNIE